MHCVKCGKEFAEKIKFCTFCGAMLSKNRKQQNKKKAIFFVLLAVVVICASAGSAWFLLQGQSSVISPYLTNSPNGEPEFVYEVRPNNELYEEQFANFWTECVHDFQTTNTALWRFSHEFVDGETVGRLMSVSPSGSRFFVAYGWRVNLHERRPLNFGGVHIERIALYDYQNGRLYEQSRIYVDFITDAVFNDTIVIAGSTGVSWSSCESRIALSFGLPMGSGFNFLDDRIFTLDVFLVDFEAMTFTNLSAFNQRAGMIKRDCLAAWIDDRNISFVRYAVLGDFISVNLMRMNIVTGEISKLANLGNEYGTLSFVYAYSIQGEYVYFTKYVLPPFCPDFSRSVWDYSGFYFVPIDGGNSYPIPLLTLNDVMDAKDGDGYMRFHDFAVMEISRDGRWALLSGSPNRFSIRDLPLFNSESRIGHPNNMLDFEEVWRLCPERNIYHIKPFTSIEFHRPWIPFHYVVLFDMQDKVMVDPFVQGHLRPDVVIAFAATFAPDGGSIIAAVLGDGGFWNENFFETITFYQIRIDDKSFEARKIYRTEPVYDGIPYLASRIPMRLSWQDNHSLWLASSTVFTSGHFLAVPSAFGRFID